MRFRAEASVEQYVYHGLAADIVAQPAHRLNGLVRRLNLPRLLFEYPNS